MTTLTVLQKRRKEAYEADDWVTFWAIDAAIMVYLDLHKQAHKSLDIMSERLEKERNR